MHLYFPYGINAFFFFFFFFWVTAYKRAYGRFTEYYKEDHFLTQKRTENLTFYIRFFFYKYWYIFWNATIMNGTIAGKFGRISFEKDDWTVRVSMNSSKQQWKLVFASVLSFFRTFFTIPIRIFVLFSVHVHQRNQNYIRT